MYFFQECVGIQERSDFTSMHSRLGSCPYTHNGELQEINILIKYILHLFYLYKIKYFAEFILLQCFHPLMTNILVETIVQ